MSGANKRLGKGATTAAHAASKKKSNAVNLTANTEANLRSALQVRNSFHLAKTAFQIAARFSH